MKVYLAHNFEARDWLDTKIAHIIRNAGHEVTSNWIYQQSGIPEKDAVQDLEDIRRSDALILYAPPFGYKPGKGKYVEFGFALALGKRCIVIDPDNCIFFKLSNVRIARDIEEAIKLV